MSQQNDGAFGGSTTIDKALEPKKVVEYTPLQMEEMITLEAWGYNLYFVKGWYKKNPSALTQKGDLRAPFFKHLLACCSPEELIGFNVTPLTPEQEGILEDLIAKLTVVDGEKEAIRLSQYIDEVAKLRKDKDELYKRIEGLQATRDELEESLKWLYEFMPRMEFTTYTPTPEAIKRIETVKRLIE